MKEIGIELLFESIKLWSTKLSVRCFPNISIYKDLTPVLSLVEYSELSSKLYYRKSVLRLL